MNLAELQVDLRHFAAERDWQSFHTPKNLSTALMVEAAELAEVFQWMTPEESQGAHNDPASKQRIAEEVADVLLYLLQVADHSQIDIAQAVKDKLERNALKYPASRAIARVSPARAAGSPVAGTDVGWCRAGDARSLWAGACPRSAGPGCCASRRAAVKGPASRP